MFSVHIYVVLKIKLRNHRLNLLMLRSQVVSDADTLLEGVVLLLVIINAVCIILSDLEIIHLAISLYIIFHFASSY